MKKIISLFIVYALACLPLCAASTDGTSTAAFLRMEQGARALGMGGAFVASYNDVECIWYNPAGATFMDGIQMNASYSDYLEDVNATYAALVLPMGTKGLQSFIGSINYVSLGKIDGRDATGAVTEKLSLKNIAGCIGYAAAQGPNMSFGAMAKIIQQDLGAYKGSGFAVDLGFLFRASPQMNIGVAVQNLGPELKTDDVSNKLPMNIRGGVNYAASKKVLLAADAEKPNDADMKGHIGSEILMSDTFQLRAGYNTSKSGGLTIGVGILTPVSIAKGDQTWWESGVERDWRHNVARIVYAYVTSGSFEATHRISLTLKF